MHTCTSLKLKWYTPAALHIIFSSDTDFSTPFKWTEIVASLKISLFPVNEYILKSYVLEMLEREMYPF